MKYLAKYDQFINESWWTDLTNWVSGGNSSDGESPINTDETPYKIKNSDHLKSCLEAMINSGQPKVTPSNKVDLQAIQTALVLTGHLTEYQVDSSVENTVSALNKFAEDEGISEKSDSGSLSKAAIEALIKKIWV